MKATDMDAEVIVVEIPFRTAVSHAGAQRRTSSAVVVRICDAQGLCGYGEGCPRDDTGESIESALAWLKARIGPWSAKVRTLEDLQRLCETHEAEIDSNPSAFCAFELAMLDYLARRAGVSIEAFLGLKGLSRPQTVTAVPDGDGSLAFHLQALRFWSAGMTAARLDAGKDTGRNRYRAGLLARFSSVRLDGNHLWPGADEAIAALTPLKEKIWAVEEPVAGRDFAAMFRIHRMTGLAIILGQSLVTGRDLAAVLALDPEPGAFVVNLGISRMGGLLRTLNMARRLKAKGMGRIIGAEAGETSCLARAAMALALEAAPLLGFEAGYGRHLLRRDPFTPSLTFDRRGVLAQNQYPLGPQGSGLEPSGLSFEMRDQGRNDMEAARTWIVEEWVTPRDNGAKTKPGDEDRINGVEGDPDRDAAPMADEKRDAAGEPLSLRQPYTIGQET